MELRKVSNIDELLKFSELSEEEKQEIQRLSEQGREQEAAETYGESASSHLESLAERTYDEVLQDRLDKLEAGDPKRIPLIKKLLQEKFTDIEDLNVEDLFTYVDDEGYVKKPDSIDFEQLRDFVAYIKEYIGEIKKYVGEILE